MGLLGDVGKSVLKGAAWYLEEASKSASRNKNYSYEQKESLRDYSNRMHDFRMSFDDDDDDDYDY